MEKITTKEFIQRCKIIYGDKFTYEKTNYINSKCYVIITCPKHGDFKIKASHFLYDKVGCKKCNKEKTTQQNLINFINKSKILYGDTYDYSKVEYVNENTKICLIHKKYGEIYVTPHSHLTNNGLDKKTYHISKIGHYKNNTDDFIKHAKLIHGDKYDYSITEYKGLKNEIKYICKIHGVITQIAHDHLKGHGCKFCYYDKNKKTNDDFINKANKIHNNKYDYSKIDMINRDEKGRICIICPIHGEFKQLPNNHLLGIGCPLCNESHLEKKCKSILIENNIDFEQQKRFDWLGRQSLDFYLPKYNIAIECQGEQHFKSVEHFGGEDEFINQLERDNRKLKNCNSHNLTLIYFSNEKINDLYVNNEIELIKKIMGE